MSIIVIIIIMIMMMMMMMIIITIIIIPFQSYSTMSTKSCRVIFILFHV